MCESTSKAGSSDKRQIEGNSAEENAGHESHPLPDWCDPKCRRNHLFVFMKSKDDASLVFKNISCYSVDVSEFDCDVWLTNSIIRVGLMKKGLYPNSWILKRRVLLDWPTPDSERNTRPEPIGVTNYEAMKKWDYWLNYSIWSSEDAALLLEFGPYKLPGIDIYRDISHGSSFFDTLKIVNSYVGSGKEPYDIISWAISNDIISIPIDLITWHKYITNKMRKKYQSISVTKDIVISMTRGLLSMCGQHKPVSKATRDNKNADVKAARWEILSVGLYSLEGYGYNKIVAKLFGEFSERPTGKWAEIRRKKFIDLMSTEHGIDCKKFMPE